MQPPKGFRPAGTVLWAEVMNEPPTWISNKSTVRGARAKGLMYERKAHAHFGSIYGEAYIPNPWIQFKNSQQQLRWAQPDALLFDFKQGILTIVEYKYQHTALAWWQLVELYLPLIKKLYPRKLWIVRLLEVVRYYDPCVMFPCEHTILKSISDLFPDQVGVYIWKPLTGKRL